MDKREEHFVRNYHIFGSDSRVKYGYTKKESSAIREKYKKKGVFLLPDKKLIENKMALQKNNTDTDTQFGAIQFAIASLNVSDQEKILEIARNLPNPQILMDQTIALQQYRVKVGMQSEFEQGRLLDSTEAAIGNLVNMIQAKNNIEEGQELNINVNNSLTALLDEIDLEDNHDEQIIIDIDKEKKKEEIKNIHNKNINDYLDEV